MAFSGSAAVGASDDATADAEALALADTETAGGALETTGAAVVTVAVACVVVAVLAVAVVLPATSGRGGVKSGVVVLG